MVSLRAIINSFDNAIDESKRIRATSKITDEGELFNIAKNDEWSNRWIAVEKIDD